MPMLKFLARLAPALVLALAAAAITACGTAAPGTPDAPQAATGQSVVTPGPSAAVVGETAPAADTAPSFALPNAAGETVSLDSYRGSQNVVLVFYRGFW